MDKSRDLNDLLREQGPEAVRSYLDQAQDITSELPPDDEPKANGRAGLNRSVLPFKLFDEITAESVAKRWIVKGVFARGETSSCFGPPGGTKSSFWADAAVHISSQEMWRCHRIKENVGVGYFAMERPDLVERRLYAYRIRDGLSGLPIAVIRNTIDMINQSCVAIIIDTIKAAEDRMRQQIGLAVLDTWAKAIAAGGGDESKPRDQSTVLANIRRVIEKLDIHFATIGHTGKDESRGERGSNAKRADMDLEVQITGDDTKTATIEKANDAPAGRLTAYQLSPVDLGVDSDGDPIQTFIIDKEEPDAAAVSKEKRQQLSSRQKLALKALTEVTLSMGREPPPRLQLPAGVRVVSADAWKDELDHRKLLEGSNPRARYAEIRDALAARNLIGVRDDLVWSALR